jgi:hypothetical protein
MRIRHVTVQWCRWLWRAGLPGRHIAIFLDIEVGDVEQCLERPMRSGTPVRIPMRRDGGKYTALRPISAQTASHVRVLHRLGYSSSKISSVLALNRKAVEDFIRRSTPARKNALVRARTRSEQRRLDRNRRRDAKAAAVRASLALWARCAAPLDDAGCAAAIILTDDELLDLVFETETPPPCPVEPTHWNQRGHQRTRWGEENGQAKLTRELAAEIRQAAADGISMYELARRHGVARGTISAIVKGRTWLEPPDENQRDDEPSPLPPPPAANQVDATNTERQRWRSAAGTPKRGARGSGSLYDDDGANSAPPIPAVEVISPPSEWSLASTQWMAMPDDDDGDVGDDR